MHSPMNVKPTNYCTDNGHTLFCWYDDHMRLHQIINLSNYMYWRLVSNLTGSWVISHIEIELKT